MEVVNLTRQSAPAIMVVSTKEPGLLLPSKINFSPSAVNSNLLIILAAPNTTQ